MNELKVLGMIESTSCFECHNRVYDVGGVSPTLSTMQGGEKVPKILDCEINCGLCSYFGDEDCDFCGCDRYDGDDEDVRIAAMRGRNPNNPSDRTAGQKLEQRLEVNTQGTANTITTVQKDNLCIESSILVPKRTEYGKAIRKDYESGIVQESRHNMTALEPRKDGVTNTITTVQKDNMVLVKQATKQGYVECECGGVADLSFPDSSTRRWRVQDNGKICPTIMSQNQELCKIETQYRIRKLTPRECGRLMGVSNEDIDKMAAINSNTQLYKQFGNSIVVDVMCAMFKNLNIRQE